MTLRYENRRGESYYLQAGKTRTGKPRYYMGRKITGTELDAVPEGFEIHEQPEHGQVLLRKIKPTRIAEFERALVADGNRRHGGPANVIVDIEGDSLVVYTSSINDAAVQDLVSHLQGLFPGAPTTGHQRVRDSLMNQAHYQKMLRFELSDADRRLFSSQRWCFRGSIDDWIYLDGPRPLPDLVQKYAKHLDKESFFDLI
jgi:hypothetical protein